MSTTEPEPIPLELANISKSFAKTKAVKSVSLELRPGEVFALVGPNGSGKTTLIKMIVGLMNPNSGTIKVLGKKQPDEAEEISQQLGFLPDDPTAYNELTGREFLWLVSRLRNLDTATAGPRIEELLTMFPLGGQPDALFLNYSRGTKQKFAFLAAIMTWPKLLVIDEPIVGLDPDSVEIFKTVIKSQAEQGTTVLFATHILEFAIAIATRVGFMIDGEILKVKKMQPGVKLKLLYHSIVTP